MLPTQVTRVNFSLYWSCFNIWHKQLFEDQETDLPLGLYNYNERVSWVTKTLYLKVKSWKEHWDFISRGLIKSLVTQSVLDVPVQIPHNFFLSGQDVDEGEEVLVSVILRKIKESRKSSEQKSRTTISACIIRKKFLLLWCFGIK